MESTELPADVVHPEVRAHITSLVSALGGTDEDGQYQLGDDALDVLRDIKKWIRFYDQKLNRMDVARCLADTNLVGGDLLRILATWHENATAQRFKARVALACYEILTPLTWPLETDTETTTVNHYRHLPVLQLAQLAYKRAIINFDGAQILHTAVRVALPAMAVPLADRAMRDQGIIKLVLFFLRNVAMIEPPPGVQYDGDESQISRSATIDAFSYQDILLLLLTMASNMGDDFRTEDATVMEIIFHLVKRVDVHKLFMDDAQLTSTNAGELTALMHKEAAMLQSFRQRGPTRHSRFGTMVWVDRGEGRMSALSGQDALVSASARELKMDTSKKFRPPRRPRRRRDEKQELMGLGPSVSLNARANGQLRGFVDELLDAGFNPLFQHVRRSVDREAPHIQHHHRAQFLYLISWFLEAERARHKAAQQRSPRDSTATADDVSSFNLVAGALNQEMFIFLNRALDQAQNDKDWAELTVVMRCYTQILLTVQQMSESKNEEDEEIAENILSRLFYEESTHDAVANMVKNYKDQGYEYLDACTELAHTYLRILETYSKQNVDLQVRSRRRTRKKKKAADKKVAKGTKEPGAGAGAGAGDNADGEEAAEGEQQQNDDDGDDESANDEELAQKTSTERKFDFKRFANRFAVQGVVDTFVKFTSNYNDLTDAQLKRAHRYFYRIAFKQEMSVMLFRVDIIRLLFNMVKGPEPLNRSSNAAYKDWEELSKQILRRCVKKIEERPVLIIEMLFSKSASTAHFLEYGFEKQTVSTTNPRPAAELEFRHAVERDRQIAIVVGVLLDKNQHQHLLWVKRQLEAAEAEKRSWRALDTAMDTLEAAGPDGAENENSAPLAELSAASPITIRPEDDACRKAMFKNAHLRLLMKLVGFERLVPSVEETPDSVWVVPSGVTAEQLRESLDFINKAEFEPPMFDNEQSAEDQLKRKTAARKKAVYDDDDENGNGNGDDEMLFPAGGPTARKIVDEGLNGRKKKTLRRRRKRQGDDDSDGEGNTGPTEEELDERAQRRRQKELEKSRRIKSDLYVHASDDETDDEKDREFFAREEAIRQRVHKAVLLSKADEVTAVGAAAAAAEKTGKKRKTAKPKRKVTVLSDDEDEDEESSSQESTASTLARQRKRRRSVETGDGDGSDKDVAEPTEAPRKKLSSRQHAGFVDSSSEEEDDENMEDVMDGNMDTDDTLMSLSPHAVGKMDKAADRVEDAGEDARKENKDSKDEDDDEEDVVPTAGKKRQRARGGFLADSDDDNE